MPLRWKCAGCDRQRGQCARALEAQGTGDRSYRQQRSDHVGLVALGRPLAFTQSELGASEGLGAEDWHGLIWFSPSQIVTVSSSLLPLTHRHPRRSCRMASYGATRLATERPALAAMGSTALWR